MRNIVWIIFDSARFDAFAAARTPAMDRIGQAARRWAYTSWTAPSHFVFLMGILPHESLTKTFASTQYRSELARWTERLGLTANATVEFRHFLPSLSLPAFLRHLGYRCEAYVSMPVLNPSTLLCAHFDRFELMPSHNDLAAIVDRLNFNEEPCFFFINTGETHYPYVLPGETADDLPVLSGLHGVWKTLDDFLRNPGLHGGSEPVFDAKTLRPLWARQVRNIEYLDSIIEQLYAVAPPNTWFIITSDHGELIGEDGYFGHGPIMHEKVFEVFLLEGVSPRARLGWMAEPREGIP